jgi:hypothetical protein
MEDEWRSPPRPAAAPDRAVLAVPADARRKRAGLDRAQHLGRQAVEPDVGRAVASGPVAVELRLPRLRQHSEAARSRPSEAARASAVRGGTPRGRGAGIRPEAPAGAAGVRFEAGQNRIGTLTA